MSDKDQQTTLAVTKEFADMLRNEYEGSNDRERLESWARTKYSYKDSITNEDLAELIEKMDVTHEGNSDIDIDDIKTTIQTQLERLSFNGRTGELEMR